jgi:pyruvate dehydrogenase E2 component (dihydrolipoamide acetyltransferase)
VAFEFKLPDLGEGIQEAELLEWNVAVGDDVQAFQPLCQVESAKAAVELTAPVAGRIGSLNAQPGDTLRVGDLLVSIDTEADSEWFGIVGRAPDVAAPAAPAVGAAAPAVRAAPFVRKLARDLNVPLEQIKGSGPQGRVRAADVEAAAQRPEAVPAGVEAAARGQAVVPDRVNEAAAQGQAVVPDRVNEAAAQRQTAVPDRVNEAAAQRLPAVRDGIEQAAAQRQAAASDDGVDERVPLRGLRKQIADHMLEAVRHAPQVTSMDLFDVTQLVHARDALQASAEADGVKLSYLPFFVKASIAALQAVPEANAVVNDQEIVLKRAYNIGIATAVPGGLVVPVVKHADKLTLLQVGQEIDRLVTAARERRSQPADLAGGTFTITSFGGLPGSPMFATPILNYPEVAILGVGRIDLQPRVVDGQVVPRQCVGISLTFDHRVMDGEAAGRFMAVLRRYLERPLEFLLRLT